MKKILNAIVVDDERLARKDLISILKNFENVKVVGEAEDAVSARLLLEKLSPDIVFLDIQMPGESGLALVEEINPGTRIVFVTAYDEYAVRAFEVNALDYLMKPVNLERLRKTLERIMSDSSKPTETRKIKYEDTLFIQLNSQMKFVKVQDIISVESSGDYTELYLKNSAKGLTSKPMREWEERLPENYFVRIHRAAIVNLSYITKVEEWFKNSFKVFLMGKAEPLVISRRYAIKLKERMG
ncbi:MAG TPA: LytTR family DNA-binding domain-containing protein [Ignavibacteria bacterium]|nr:LytTR family DNA-binding domain-containing protein [Ignavibacteria bacterium]